MSNYSTLMYASNKKLKSDNTETALNGDNVEQTEENVQRPLHLTLDDERQRAYLNSLGQESSTGLRYINSDRDLSMPLDRNRGQDNYYDSPEDGEAIEYYPESSGQVRNIDQFSFPNTKNTKISIRKYLGVGVQWVSLVTENLLSHPFIVLRRQCQVYNASTRYHLHPFGLLPSIVHLHSRQGVTTLWKGLGSCLLVRGMSLAIEDVLSKATSWPKEVDNRISLKRFGQHLLLKCISIAVVVPYYSASLVETVQSDIASEKPGLFDVFREGSLRLLYWSSPQKGRMLPAWALIGPSVSLGITKYFFSLIIKGLSYRIIRRRIQHSQESKGAKYKDDSLENQNVEIYSNLISMLTSEMIFYPFETILHRIQLQGTRTIVDNLDNGYAVVPILTNYQGAIDCYRTTVASEGFAGLYKGFGAIILQFAAHIAVIKLTKWVVNQITEVIANRPPPKVIQYYNLDRGLNSNSTTISPSISSSSNLDNSVGHQSVD